LYVNLLLVAIGGAVGSAARYLLTAAVARHTPPVFPFGTFAVNAAGCVVLGLIVGAAEQRFLLSTGARAFLLVGVLGGFTTFSTFALENVQLIRAGDVAYAALNTAGQVAIGILGLWAGYALTTRL
jgi:CrcB protein